MILHELTQTFTSSFLNFSSYLKNNNVDLHPLVTNFVVDFFSKEVMLWFEDETKSYFAFLSYVGFTPQEVVPSIIELFDQNRMYAVMTICFATTVLFDCL